MRHRKKVNKLNRDRRQRKALLKTLANSLIVHEKIVTTHAKAKALAPFVERLVTYAKKDDITAVRTVSRYTSAVAGKKLIQNLSVRYKDRRGGYTRIIKLTQRKRDSAQMAKIELVQ